MIALILSLSPCSPHSEVLLKTPLTRKNSLNGLSYTGLSSNENIDAVVVSEPMIGSQAYSLVLVKVKDGQDAIILERET